MDDPRRELGDLARLMSGLVRWDLEDDALGYSRAAVRADDTGGNSPTMHPPSEGTPQSSTSDSVAKEQRSGESNAYILVAEGNTSASVVFIGEGMGGQASGQRPFSGPAGELLDKMIRAMGVDLQDVYICTTGRSNNPSGQELGDKVLVHTQLELMRPRVVIALGTLASQMLLNTTQPLASLRGTLHPFLGAQLMPTYHPNDLLQHPANKRDAWGDLQKVMELLGLKK